MIHKYSHLTLLSQITFLFHPSAFSSLFFILSLFLNLELGHFFPKGMERWPSTSLRGKPWFNQPEFKINGMYIKLSRHAKTMRYSENQLHQFTLHTAWWYSTMIYGQNFISKYKPFDQIFDFKIIIKNRKKLKQGRKHSWCICLQLVEQVEVSRRFSKIPT